MTEAGHVVLSGKFVKESWVWGKAGLWMRRGDDRSKGPERPHLSHLDRAGTPAQRAWVMPLGVCRWHENCSPCDRSPEEGAPQSARKSRETFWRWQHCS